jgi:hypothetical protein
MELIGHFGPKNLLRTAKKGAEFKPIHSPTTANHLRYIGLGYENQRGSLGVVINQTRL